MNNSLISVVITTYNRTDLLKRAVRSVISQSYQKFEIVIIDDCSTEDVAGAVKSFNSEKIVYVRNNTNLGASEAKNAGIRKAMGEYVIFLDDDDEFLPGALEIVMNAITPETKALFPKCRMIFEDNRTRDMHPFNPPESFAAIRTGVFRRDVFDEIGLLDNNLKNCQDDDLGLRLIGRYDKEDLKIIPDVTVKIYNTAGSLSCSDNSQIIRCRDYERLLNKHFALIKAKFGARYLSGQFYGFGKFLLQKGEPKKAREWFAKAISVSPFSFRNTIKFLSTFKNKNRKQKNA